MYFIDGHCDTLTLALSKGEDLFTHKGHLNLEKLAHFKPAVQVFAIWLNDEEVLNAYESTIKVMDHAHTVFNSRPDCIRLATSYADIINNINSDVCSAILGAEGAEPIGKDLDNLRKLHEKGLRVLTLTWNRHNAVSGCIQEPNLDGLSEFGRETVAECERLGVIIDVSHISTKGFWDVIETTAKPFIASHSNCKALASHRRNLDDEQIKALANKGGVIGANFCDAFLSDTHDPTMDDVVRHIDHIIKVGGEDCAAIGGDLDGTASPKSGWYKDVMLYEPLYARLVKDYGSTLADKIFFGNYLRLFKDTLR